MSKASRKIWQQWWFWVAAAAIGLLIWFVLFSPTFKEWVEGITDWAERLMRAYPLAGGAAFFALTAVSAMLTFASSIVLVPAANEVWGKPLTFLLLWGGWFVGSVAAYAIAYYARPLIVRLIDKEKLEKYQDLVSKRMNFAMLLVFCIAAQSEISGYVLGGLRYPLWRSLAAMAIAEAMFAIGIIVAGESLLEARPVTLVATVGILIALAVGAGFLLRHRKARKRKR